MVTPMKNRLAALAALAATATLTLAGCSNNETTPAEQANGTTTAPSSPDELTPGQQAVYDIVAYLPTGLGADFPVEPFISPASDCDTDAAVAPLNCAFPDEQFFDVDGDPSNGIIIANVGDGFAALTSEDGTVWCAAARGVTVAYGEGADTTSALKDCTNSSW